jgi:hypothetical protein
MRRYGFSLRYLFLALAAPVVFILTSVRVEAQVDTGSVQGTITDQTGAVIPNSKVTLTNEGTNFSLTMNSVGDGTYIFNPVKLGTYSVSAEAPGFAKAVQSHLALNIDQHIVANLTLTPGAVTQTVEVTGAAPALQTQDASVGQVVEARSVNDLPLNGRNFTFLAQVVAGVNTPQADTRGNAANGAFSANGMRPSQNNYLLDGIDNNSDNVDFLNGTNYVVLPPPDALSEFKVQTTNFSAQYGRAGGAIMNATIKSGTNQIHGSAWEFLRNDKIDAADFFEDVPGAHKGEYRQNQFGGTIGGPVVIPHLYNGRNKLFFFGDYEGTRRRQASVFTNAVPTPDEVSSGFTNLADSILGQTNAACIAAATCTYTDILGRTLPDGVALDPTTMREFTAAGQVDPVTGLKSINPGYVDDPFYQVGGIATPVGNMMNFTGLCPSDTNCQLNQLPGSRFDPNALKLLGLYPAATLVGTAASPIIYNNNSTDPVLAETRNAIDTRMDWNKSEKDQVFGTFSFVNDPQFIPGPFKGIADGGAFTEGDQTAKSILAALSYTHIFSPSTVNELRIGEDRLHATRFPPIGTTMGIPAQFGIQGIAQVAENGGLPAIGIGGLNTLGSNAYLPSDEITQTTQITDNLTKTFGKHTFKMGLEMQHIKFSTLQPAWSHGQIDFDGTYTGVGMAQLLLNPEATTVAGGINDVGGSDALFVSNFSPTDDGHNYWAGYFQDDWKVTPKLTLNLGVRWDHFGQIQENHGRQANFVPGTPFNGAEYLEPSNGKNQAIPINSTFTTGLAKDGIALKYISNPALATSQDTNFGPRIGIAYQVTHKLVIRTGYGIWYNGFENAGYGPNIGENYPFQFTLDYFNPTSGTPITIPNATGGNCITAATLETTFSCIPLNPALVDTEGLGLEGLQYNFKTPYTQGWNFTAEYMVAPSMSLTVGYVGNTTRHLDVGPGANEDAQIVLNPLQPISGPGGVEPFPDFGSGGSEQLSEGNSYYNGLQTSFEKRYANGMNFLAAYTYSHCRSDSGDLLNGSAIGYRGAWLPGFGIQGDYGDCDFNIFNVFHFSGGYQLPFGNGRKFLGHSTGVTNQVVGGWQMVWNATLEGGQPITIGCPFGTNGGTNGSIGCDAMLTGKDPHGSGAPNNFLNPAGFAQPCPAPGYTQPSTCVPSGTGFGLLGGSDATTTGPSIGRLDFSLFKGFRLSDRARMEFRAEFFNILNHPTFNAPGFSGNGVTAVPNSTNFFNPAFGAIGSTRFPFQDPRQIQFALKFYF